MEKYVYLFSEGNKDMKNLLGGKGANLAEMTNIGLPVPSGFTVTTEACNKYYDDGKVLDDAIIQEIKESLIKLEEKTGKKFGDLENPLLVSVRSGARASMPGMMDTVLNLGLNDEIAASFAKKIGNKRFVYDSYRRFVQMFADVVKGYSKSKFEEIIDEIKKEKKVKNDIDLDEDDMIIDKIKLNEVKAIFIDEVQFFTSKQIDELYLISKAKEIPVICYGLRTDFRMQSFEGSMRLLEISDVLEEIPTLCKCGSIARYAGRKLNGKYVTEGEKVVIDGKKDYEYVPLCGKCYLTKVKQIDLDEYARKL